MEALATDVMDLLLNDDRIDTTATDETGANVLHYLCKPRVNIRSSPICTEKEIANTLSLVLQSSKVAYIRDTSNGWTPLHLACVYKMAHRVEAILKATPTVDDIDVNERDDLGRTPLHLSCVICRVDDRDSLGVLLVLLKYAKEVGIDLEKTDVYRRTPLHHLCESWTKLQVGEFLKMAKENYGIEFNLKVKDKDGKNPMELCRK